ncbi:MAG: hypothetical protein F4X01_01180, partial [Nitrospira sp. SB0661_bin_20]|nr:hypothetical protein [Nitrospira sp. SB0661_bin_20]
MSARGPWWRCLYRLAFLPEPFPRAGLAGRCAILPARRAFPVLLLPVLLAGLATPAAAQVVSIAGGGGVTEGGTATFTLTASPAPSAPIAVNVDVTDSGSFAGAGQTG